MHKHAVACSGKVVGKENAATILCGSSRSGCKHVFCRSCILADIDRQIADNFRNELKPSVRRRTSTLRGAGSHGGEHVVLLKNLARLKVI